MDTPLFHHLPGVRCLHSCLMYWYTFPIFIFFYVSFISPVLIHHSHYYSLSLSLPLLYHSLPLNISCFLYISVCIYFSISIYECLCLSLSLCQTSCNTACLQAFTTCLTFSYACVVPTILLYCQIGASHYVCCEPMY